MGSGSSILYATVSADEHAVHSEWVATALPAARHWKKWAKRGKEPESPGAPRDVLQHCDRGQITSKEPSPEARSLAEYITKAFIASAGKGDGEWCRRTQEVALVPVRTSEELGLWDNEAQRLEHSFQSAALKAARDLVDGAEGVEFLPDPPSGVTAGVKGSLLAFAAPRTRGGVVLRNTFRHLHHAHAAVLEHPTHPIPVVVPPAFLASYLGHLVLVVGTADSPLTESRSSIVAEGLEDAMKEVFHFATSANVRIATSRRCSAYLLPGFAECILRGMRPALTIAVPAPVGDDSLSQDNVVHTLANQVKTFVDEEDNKEGALDAEYMRRYLDDLHSHGIRVRQLGWVAKVSGGRAADAARLEMMARAARDTWAEALASGVSRDEATKRLLKAAVGKEEVRSKFACGLEGEVDHLALFHRICQLCGVATKHGGVDHFFLIPLHTAVPRLSPMLRFLNEASRDRVIAAGVALRASLFTSRKRCLPQHRCPTLSALCFMCSIYHDKEMAECFARELLAARSVMPVGAPIIPAEGPFALPTPHKWLVVQALMIHLELASHRQVATASKAVTALTSAVHDQVPDSDRIAVAEAVCRIVHILTNIIDISTETAKTLDSWLQIVHMYIADVKRNNPLLLPYVKGCQLRLSSLTGKVLALEGKTMEAKKVVMEAAEGVVLPDDYPPFAHARLVDFMRAMAEIGVILLEEGEAGVAEEVLRKALAMMKTSGKLDHPLSPLLAPQSVATDTLALTTNAVWDSTVSSLGGTLSRSRRFERYDKYDVATTTNNLGFAVQSQGRDDEALELFNDAVNLYGEGPPLDGVAAYNNLASVMYNKHNITAYNRAERLYLQALGACERAPKSYGQHPDEEGMRRNLGILRKTRSIWAAVRIQTVARRWLARARIARMMKKNICMLKVCGSRGHDGVYHLLPGWEWVNGHPAWRGPGHSILWFESRGWRLGRHPDAAHRALVHQRDIPEPHEMSKWEGREAAGAWGPSPDLRVSRFLLEEELACVERDESLARGEVVDLEAQSLLSLQGEYEKICGGLFSAVVGEELKGRERVYEEQGSAWQALDEAFIRGARAIKEVCAKRTEELLEQQAKHAHEEHFGRHQVERDEEMERDALQRMSQVLGFLAIEEAERDALAREGDEGYEALLSELQHALHLEKERKVIAYRLSQLITSEAHARMMLRAEEKAAMASLVIAESEARALCMAKAYRFQRSRALGHPGGSMQSYVVRLQWDEESIRSVVSSNECAAWRRVVWEEEQARTALLLAAVRTQRPPVAIRELKPRRRPNPSYIPRAEQCTSEELAFQRLRSKYRSTDSPWKRGSTPSYDGPCSIPDLPSDRRKSAPAVVPGSCPDPTLPPLVPSNS
eukprot:Sspe_Gene.26643::Locus_11181_Transcript_1_1_Confidence_1.000_Length_4181::g.26643::m.26643